MKSPPIQFSCCGLWGIEWAGIMRGLFVSVMSSAMRDVDAAIFHMVD